MRDPELDPRQERTTVLNSDNFDGGFGDHGHVPGDLNGGGAVFDGDSSPRRLCSTVTDPEAAASTRAAAAARDKDDGGSFAQ